MMLEILRTIVPRPLRPHLRGIYRRFVPAPPEPSMYRRHLFAELQRHVGEGAIADKRILEIGPRDGLDSARLASLAPAELVMVELPEKRESASPWLKEIPCRHRYVEANIMYMPKPEFDALGRFDLIWCTGVLYHNAEQLRLLRKLYRLLNVGGYLVLESATLRGSRWLSNGAYVQIHYPRTYRDTGTSTHMPSAGAILAWLAMVGFSDVHVCDCYTPDNRNLIGIRMACVAHKTGEDDADSYYAKSGCNPEYRYGDSV